MAKDRSRDDRRSVGSHEKMMGALGKATGWESMGSDQRVNVIGRFGNDNLGPVSSSSPIAYTGQPHVKESHYGKVEGKYDSEGNTDDWRSRNDTNDRIDIKKYNQANQTTPLKINSGSIDSGHVEDAEVINEDGTNRYPTRKGK
jgi:hypothetical protein